VTSRTEPFECIFLELTNRCNFDCLFCPNGSMTRPRGQMDDALARRLLDEIADKGLCRWVNLSLMGEPLMHPNLLSIARHGVRLGLPIHLITNLSLLTSERIRQLLELPIAHLALSLQTPTQEGFGLKNASDRYSLEQSMEAIDMAVRAKLEIGSPTEITIHLLTTRLERPRGKALLESTRQRLGLAHRFRERAGSWAREFSLPVPKPPPFREPLCFWLGLDAFVPLLPGVALCFKRATLWANTLLVEGAEVEPRENGMCQLALDTLGILWDGSLTLCCLDFDGVLTFGCAADRSISEVLQSDGHRNLRRTLAEGHLSQPFCQRCRGRVIGPSAGQVVPGSLPALVGEGLKYLGRFQFRRTLRRIPQEISKYLAR
jgi:organic radical activating enzyme